MTKVLFSRYILLKVLMPRYRERRVEVTKLKDD